MTLQVKNLIKQFDGVHALQGLSFEICAGECVALIGPNGAGKSTAFACIAGQQRLNSGEVWWAGERIESLTPAQRLRRGVARTFQMAQTFEALTVLQNVQFLLQAPQGLAAWNRLDSVQLDAAHALLVRVGLQTLANAEVLGLPYGAKKRLELALALAGVAGTPGARLLLLDEPAAGLAGAERADLMRLVKLLVHESADAGGAASGLAVLYSEHNMDAVFGVADRVLVLMDGSLAAQGSPHEIAHNETVQARYLGLVGAAALKGQPEPASDSSHVEVHGHWGLDPQSRLAPPGTRIESGMANLEEVKAAGSSVILSVQHLNVWYGAASALFDVSLQVGRGELVVLQGLNGAGKSTLLQAIMGLGSRASGSIVYENKSVSDWEPYQRAQAGLGYVPEDRRLFGGLTVQENLRLAARRSSSVPLRKTSVAGGAAAPGIYFDEARALDLFPALKPMLGRRASQMSGGEQQMLAIARTLMTSPQLLLLDEPCEGIAPVLIECIVAALLALQTQGLSILAAEQNSLLASQAARVITLVAGQVKL
jgi:branched-chain amino acid transport system ATP-binding protein